MARIRTIKPEFWTDEKITECSLPARLLFIGMLNFADDNGNLGRSSKRIKMQVFPADAFDCEPLIQELIDQELLSEYSVSTHGVNQHFLHIIGFNKHQLINRPSKSSIPLHPSQQRESSQSDTSPSNEDSLNPHGGLNKYSLSHHRGLNEDSGTEGKGRDTEEEEERKESDCSFHSQSQLAAPAENENKSENEFLKISKRIQEIICAPLPLDMGHVRDWMAWGGDYALIERTVLRVMERKSGIPPTRLSYFNNAIKEAIQDQNSPAPKGQNHAQRSSNTNGSHEPQRFADQDYFAGTEGFNTISGVKPKASESGIRA